MHKRKYQNGEIIKTDFGDITIIEHIHGTNKYRYLCSICGKEGIGNTRLISQSKTICPCLSRNRVIIGKNDIPTKAQWMIDYFQGGINEARLYTPDSSRYINPVCPFCGKVSNKQIQVSNIYRKHGFGCHCKDTISFPNKVMDGILRQLEVYYIAEYSPSYLKDTYNRRVQRFDFYIPQQNLIIEMDGGIGHYGRNINPLYDVKQADKFKERMARKRGLTLVRIDARDSTLDYIYPNIKNKLSAYFNFDDIDYDKLIDYCHKNIIKLVCDAYMKNNKLSATDVAHDLNMKVSTVKKYLRIGSDLGWVSMHHNESERRKKISNSRRKKSKRVVYTDNNGNITVYKDVFDASKFTGTSISSIRNNLCGLSNKTRNGYFIYSQ